MQQLALQTLRFIDKAVSKLDEYQALPLSLRRFAYQPWWHRQYPQDVQHAREFVLEIEEVAKQLALEVPLSEVNAQTAGELFPVFHDVVQVLPLFNHAVLLECHRPLVRPSEVQTLLYLLKIPSCGEGMDIENHGFGYHFHYGKVKAGTVARTNLLLTFDPPNSGAKRSRSPNHLGPPLLGEYHAEGKNKTISMETIGHNKRLPIYSVCLLAGEKRGFANFKQPKNEAVVFHSGKVAA